MENFKTVEYRKWLLIGAMLIGGGLIIAGLFRGIQENSQIEVEYLKAGDSGGSDQNNAGKIVVDVEGAVEAPGVYEIDNSSRIKDALVAAGGLSDNADRDAVSRMINLAEQVKDSQKIFIPSIGSHDTDVGYSATDSEAKIVSVNTASADDLDTLWGIGEAKAKAIIDGRPYSSLDDLVTRKIISQSVLDKNKGRVSVY